MCERAYHAVTQATQEVSQTVAYDRITIILTALGVMIAVLGVIFALASLVFAGMAWYGRQEIIQAAERAALKSANEFLEKNMTAEGLLGRFLNQMTPSTAGVAPSATIGEARDETVAQVEVSPALPVAEAYPEEEGEDVSREHEDKESEE